MYMKLCFSNIFCILGFVTFILQQRDKNMAFSLKFLDFYLFVCISGAFVLVGVRELVELAFFHCGVLGVEFEVVWLSHRYFFLASLLPGSELPPLPSVLIPCKPLLCPNTCKLLLFPYGVPVPSLSTLQV